MSVLLNPYRYAGGGGGGGGSGTPPAFQASGTLVGNAGSVTANWPTHVSGDIGILFIKTGNQAPPATPTGCTPIYTPTGTGTPGAVGAVMLSAYWIRATSSAMPGITTGDSGDDNIAIILTFRGCVASGSPIDVTATNTATTSTSVTIPGLTTSGDNRYVVAACGIGLPDAVNTTNASGWTNSDLASITEILDQATISGNGGGFVAAGGVKTLAGTVGSTTATLANTAAQERLCFALIGT